METITLQQVVPDAFADDPEVRASDVWGRDVTFRKGEYYLVEAAWEAANPRCAVSCTGGGTIMRDAFSSAAKIAAPSPRPGGATCGEGR